MAVDLCPSNSFTVTKCIRFGSRRLAKWRLPKSYPDANVNFRTDLNKQTPGMNLKLKKIQLFQMAFTDDHDMDEPIRAAVADAAFGNAVLLPKCEIVRQQNKTKTLYTHCILAFLRLRFIEWTATHRWS